MHYTQPGHASIDSSRCPGVGVPLTNACRIAHGLEVIVKRPFADMVLTRQELMFY